MLALACKVLTLMLFFRKNDVLVLLLAILTTSLINSQLIEIVSGKKREEKFTRVAEVFERGERHKNVFSAKRDMAQCLLLKYACEITVSTFCSDINPNFVFDWSSYLLENIDKLNKRMQQLKNARTLCKQIILIPCNFPSFPIYHFYHHQLKVNTLRNLKHIQRNWEGQTCITLLFSTFLRFVATDVLLHYFLFQKIMYPYISNPQFTNHETQLTQLYIYLHKQGIVFHVHTTVFSFIF